MPPEYTSLNRLQWGFYSVLAMLRARGNWHRMLLPGLRGVIGTPTARSYDRRPRRSRAMPIYEYRCEQCGSRFEVTQSIAQHGREKPACPRCKSAARVASVPSTFSAITSRKA